MIRVWRVRGNSLAPEVKDGEFVLAVNFPILFSLHNGDKVLFHHPQYGVLIKEVKAIDAQHHTVWVEGSHPYSVDSRSFGPIDREHILGKVIWHIRKT